MDRWVGCPPRQVQKWGACCRLSSLSAQHQDYVQSSCAYRTLHPRMPMPRPCAGAPVWESTPAHGDGMTSMTLTAKPATSWPHLARNFHPPGL